MVAIALIALVLIGIPLSNPNTDRDLINEGIDNLRRAVRFAANEAILKNSLVRINFNLDASPQEFVVEFSNTSKLTLNKPTSKNSFSLAEREKAQKKEKQFNSKFSIAKDFSPTPIPLKEGVRLEGITTSYLDEIISEGFMGVYFYPTGERDNAAIFLSSFSEVGMLAIEAFDSRTDTEFLVLEDVTQDNYTDKKDRALADLYQQWMSQ